MKNLLNHLKSEDISVLFEKIHAYGRTNESLAWTRRASNFLKLIVDIAEYRKTSTKYNRLIEATVLDNLLTYYRNRDLEQPLHDRLSSYLMKLPGFDKLKKKQSEDVYQQHGFLSMNLIRYINDISINTEEYIIFDSQWINKEEKRLFIEECFKNLFENTDLNIITIFEKISSECSLTNFTFWDFYLKNLDNQYFSDFACDILGYSVSLPMFKYAPFLEEIKSKIQIIDWKESISIELSIRDSINKKAIIKI